ncbi:MAG: very short patch repair endonuclease [Candidatus Obscuribacterales bacterium]|nr:very short patch repair endonuclease [Candidatus Obscuribacterales bacterium]
MDTLTKSNRSKLMSSIRSANTGPEKVVRSLLFKMGYRYRLHAKQLPGKPDIALARYRTAIFVHGCFWHGCTNCDRGTRVPKTNREKWLEKINSNRERDRRVQLQLSENGWNVLVVWACELSELEKLREKLQQALKTVA